MPATTTARKARRTERELRRDLNIALGYLSTVSACIERARTFDRPAALLALADRELTAALRNLRGERLD